jgi:hypothetical protein
VLPEAEVAPHRFSAPSAPFARTGCSPVSARPRGLPPTPQPRSSHLATHPLVAFAPLQGVAPRSPPQPSRVRPLPWGSVPLRRHQHRESTRPRLASPGAVPASTFRTPSPACSSRRLADLFHPASVHGVPPFRGFPSQGAAPPRRRRFALVAFVPDLHRRPRFRRPRAPPTRASRIRAGAFHRLQGLAPPGSPSPRRAG